MSERASLARIIWSVVALGLLVGWLTGLGGPDATAAAVLPALIPAAGVAAFFAVQRSGDPVLQRDAPFGFVLFCVTIFIGVHLGVWERNASSGAATERGLEDREGLLLTCTRMEYKVNTARVAGYGLPPPPSEYFCKL